MFFKLRATEIDFRTPLPPGGGEGGREDTPYHGLYWEAPPKRGTFFRLQVYKSVGIPQVEVYKRVGKLFIRYLKGPTVYSLIRQSYRYSRYVKGVLFSSTEAQSMQIVIESFVLIPLFLKLISPS